MSFNDDLMNKTIEIEQIVAYYLPKINGYQKTVIDAMNYSFMAGGKRLRPMIMQETYKAFGGTNEEFVQPFMAALEMIHNYSLVHDDLPEMDNDELRRGKPTTHVKYGQAMAVLAGDGLLNYSFETAFKAFDNCESKEDYELVAKALKVLAGKAGIYGMIGGQTLDVESEKKETVLSQDEIIFIDENKTAALLQAALMIGGILAGADESQINMLEKIGYNVGIAFQLQDDILDITSSTEVLGKPVGSDIKNQKATYITYAGLDEAINKQKNLSIEAVNMWNGLFDKDEDNASVCFVSELISYLVDRNM